MHKGRQTGGAASWLAYFAVSPVSAFLSPLPLGARRMLACLETTMSVSHKYMYDLSPLSSLSPLNVCCLFLKALYPSSVSLFFQNFMSFSFAQTSCPLCLYCLLLNPVGLFCLCVSCLLLSFLSLSCHLDLNGGGPSGTPARATTHRKGAPRGPHWGPPTTCGFGAAAAAARRGLATSASCCSLCCCVRAAAAPRTAAASAAASAAAAAAAKLFGNAEGGFAGRPLNSRLSSQLSPFFVSSVSSYTLPAPLFNASTAATGRPPPHSLEGPLEGLVGSCGANSPY